MSEGSNTPRGNALTLLFTPDPDSDSSLLLPKILTITAEEDPNRNDVRELSIVHAIVSGSQEGYESVPPVEVSLILIDPKVLVSTTALSLVEGEEGAYSLMLTSPPENDVVVEMSFSGAISLNKQRLRFTSTNWHRPQRVTVTAVDDALSNGRRTAAIGHEIKTSDPNYREELAPGVEVAIDDDDSGAGDQAGTESVAPA